MAELQRMNDDELTEWLERRWGLTLANTNAEKDPDVDRLVNSATVSIRYAFVTQLLGKFAQPDRDVLCLQMGSPDEAADTGRWNPRSFCSKLIVPWVQRNQNVLGTSAKHVHAAFGGLASKTASRDMCRTGFPRYAAT